MNVNISGPNKLKKIFGIGPMGAVISFLLFALCMWANLLITLPIIPGHEGILKAVGIILMASGILLHFWSFYTLRSWWADDELCTGGPFRYFRHPMYAAWITFICPGIALVLNSWFYLFWICLLHLLWHKLVQREELTMINTFGKTYKDYAKRTGRFFPKLENHSNNQTDSTGH